MTAASKTSLSRMHTYSRRPGWSGVAGTTVLVFGIALVAVLFGLIAYTANPVFVALGLALVVGPMLMLRPAWVIWIILVLGLMVVGVVGLRAEGVGNKAVWGISALTFLLLVLSLFRALTAPEARRNTPAFVWLSLLFLVYAILNSLFQGSSTYELIAGIKRYFQGAGVLFALTWLVFNEKDIHRWRTFFIILAVVQLPWAAYELIHFVPIREALRRSIPLLVPIDVVAGTFGASLVGGGANSSMAVFLIMVTAFLLARYREKLLSPARLLLLFPLILAPIFMSETKLVLVLMPVMFIGLYWREILSRPLASVVGLTVGGMITVGAGFAYLSMSKKSPDQRIQDTLAYNLGDRGYGGRVLNRTTALTFWVARQGVDDPISIVVGNGIGASHESESGVGHIARLYAGYGIGLTSIAILLWDQGLFGLTLYLSIFIAAWLTANRLRKYSNERWVCADAAAVVAVIPVMGLFLLHNDSAFETLSYQILASALLGYLAWLHKRQSKMSARPAK